MAKASPPGLLASPIRELYRNAKKHPDSKLPAWMLAARLAGVPIRALDVKKTQQIQASILYAQRREYSQAYASWRRSRDWRSTEQYVAEKKRLDAREAELKKEFKELGIPWRAIRKR